MPFRLLTSGRSIATVRLMGSLRGIIRLGVAAGALALGMTPSVAWSYSYNQDFGPSDFGGYGNYQGTLDFNDARRFSYYTTIQDICPADNLGVSFYFLAIRAGDQFPSPTPPKGWDTNNCGNGFFEYSGTIGREWDVGSARVIACWTNDGNLCWAVPLNGWSNLKDNPYT